MTRRYGILLLLVMASAGSPLLGQTRDELASKQLKAAQDNLKLIDIEKPVVVSTTDLIIISSITPQRTNAYATLAQKVYTAASTALKYGPMAPPWPGKLTVYLFGERDQYASFSRKVLQQRPGVRDAYKLMLKEKNPAILAIVANDPAKREAELIREPALAVGLGLLQQIVDTPTQSTELPDWITLGFRNVIQYKVEPGTASAAYRKQLKALVAKSVRNPKPPSAWDVWAAQPPKDYEVLATGLTEYLLTGLADDQFNKFLRGFKGSEEQPNPNAETALGLISLDKEKLDTAWKAWIAKLR